jgi:hypothetical protein
MCVVRQEMSVFAPKSRFAAKSVRRKHSTLNVNNLTRTLTLQVHAENCGEPQSTGSGAGQGRQGFIQSTTSRALIYVKASPGFRDDINALQDQESMTMSLEVFEKLEAKVQQAIDTITLLQMEIEELKEKNNTLAQDVQSAQQSVKSWSVKTTS